MLEILQAPEALPVCFFLGERGMQSSATITSRLPWTTSSRLGGVTLGKARMAETASLSWRLDNSGRG